MAKMTTAELKALLQAEKSASLGTDHASELVEQRTDAMDYYLGDMSKDMPAQRDRSKAVSTDVADTIEGLMPSLIEIFASGDEVMAFEPVGPEDEEAAEQETEYVNHVFMQKNPGFLVLYTFIKDALLQKNGIVKVWWETAEEQEDETYLDQPEEAFIGIQERAASEGYEIVEHTDHGDGTHDYTLRMTKGYGCAKVENVPPEEFGITRRAKSIKDSDYCFHQTKKSESSIIAQGYDKEQVKKLGSAGTLQSEEDEARDTVEDESTGGDTGENDATRLIWVTEHYVKCDYDGSGKPRLWRITTGGDDLEVLTKKGKPDVVKVNRMPFSAMTPIIMPHRFYGLSVADIVMDIQRIKTAITRGYLDQLYLTINPPVEVAKEGAGDHTLDDLLVNRPGKIVRTKTAGSVIYHRPTSQGAEALPALEYFDATREWRTGVTRQGQGIDAKALADQSATAANQQFTAAQARMRLIARIFAETGIKDLFLLLHATIRENDKAQNTARLRGKWVQIDPRSWKTRNDLTVTVGINGSKDQQMMFINNLLGIQEKFIMAGKGHMVKDSNLYASVKKLVVLGGEKSVEPYFSDPDEVDEMGQPVNPPQQQPPDPKMIELQMKGELEQQKLQATQQTDAQKMQMQAEIEATQARADIATHQQKTQADIQLAREKAELQERLAIMEANLERLSAQREEERREREFQQKMQMQARQHEQDSAIKVDSHQMSQHFAEDTHQMKVRQQSEAAKGDGE